MAGGIDWFRWHHGSVTDPKFGLIAKKAGARVGDVIAVWALVLESASGNEERGVMGQVDAEAIEFLLGMEDGMAFKILDAMTQRGLLGVGGRVESWEKRQPKREREGDNSTDRSRAFREKQRQEKQCNATQRQETPREEESREEEKREEKTGESSPRKRSTPTPAIAKPDDVDQQTWDDWLALRKAKRAPVTETVVKGARDEADKATMLLDAFLQVWCLRGSQGLQADWLRPDERKTASRVQPVSYAQQDKADKRAEWEAMTGRKWPDADAVPEFIDAEEITPRRIAA